LFVGATAVFCSGLLLTISDYGWGLRLVRVRGLLNALVLLLFLANMIFSLWQGGLATGSKS